MVVFFDEVVVGELVADGGDAIFVDHVIGVEDGAIGVGEELAGVGELDAFGVVDLFGDHVGGDVFEVGDLAGDEFCEGGDAVDELEVIADAIEVLVGDVLDGVGLIEKGFDGGEDGVNEVVVGLTLDADEFEILEMDDGGDVGDGAVAGVEF